LFTALVPTFLEKVIDQHHPWVIGASVSLLFGAAVLTQLSIRGLRARAAIELGLAVLIVGLAVLTASLDVASYPLFIVGTVISGVAVGAAFSGGLATALSVAGDSERGRVSSLFYLIAYVGITIPVIGAGIGVAEAGILSTFIVVGAVLAVFDLAALIYLRRRPSETNLGSGGNRFRRSVSYLRLGISCVNCRCICRLHRADLGGEVV
jgi:MFS family permease